MNSLSKKGSFFRSSGIIFERKCLFPQYLQKIASSSFRVRHFAQDLKSDCLCHSATSINTRIVIDEITASKIGPSITNTAPKSFHPSVIGTISPYPTVVIVTTPHQRVCGIEAKSAFTPDSK